MVSQKPSSKKILFFLSLVLLLGLGACVKLGEEGTPEGSKFGAPEGEGDSGKDTGETSLGYEERADGKMPTVPLPTAPPISDGCLTTHVGDPLCKLVPVAIDSFGGILGIPSGTLTYKYDTQARVTESKLFDLIHPSPLQTILTSYDPNGAKLTEVITNDFDSNGQLDGMDFTDTLQSNTVSPSTRVLVYRRTGPNLQKDYDVKHFLFYSGTTLLGNAIITYEGGTSYVTEQLVTYFKYISSTQLLEVSDTIHQLRGPNDLFPKNITRTYNKYTYIQYNNVPLLDILGSQTFDCGYFSTDQATNCLANPPTNAQDIILTLDTETKLNRNPDGSLSSFVTKTRTKDLSDKTKPANDPSHPVSTHQVDCLVFYLNNAYQVKESPEPLKLFFGGTTLAPNLIECTDQNNATSTLKIYWAALYYAAGESPPGGK